MRTPEYLADVYFKTVGGNASMLLNIPPDKTGKINKREIATLEGFSKIIEDAFRERIPFDITVIDTDGEEFILDAPCFMLQDNEVAVNIYPVAKFRTLMLEEDIAYSQRVEGFRIYANEEKVDDYTVIGSGKIIRFPKGLETDKLTIVFTQSRSNPIIKSVKLFK